MVCKSRKVTDTKHYSKCIGRLTKGCKQCVTGSKTVLFITGLCSQNCTFCPISNLKKNKDVIYANERPITKFSELAEEIKLCDSKGVGITGGDPLVKIDRTCNWIKKLKKKFGMKFHIHLYTPLVLVSKKNLKKLFLAGLDEIRFHPVINNNSNNPNNKLWSRIFLASEYNWKIGVEIPVIPGKLSETKKLIDYVCSHINFLNLNELELSDTNASKLVDQGFRAKDSISYGVSGSEEMAKKLLTYCLNKTSLSKNKLSVHYCTTTLKDKIQLANRIKKRAKNVKQEFDILEKDGILIRGAIYDFSLKPGMGYLDKVKKISLVRKSKILAKLKKIEQKLRKEFKVPKELLSVDKNKLRLLTNEVVVDELSNYLNGKGFACAIVHEYPTWDAMQLEVEFL
ncbi:radical SAM protein [Candidatus Woesearchaeota archaeon]|nr:radical SAM protein [Candidatus Woesearchaeota archaeon]